MTPIINEYELEQVVKCLEVINPGRSSEDHIKAMIHAQWPFDNLSTGGWLAYAEAPDSNNNVRLALTPYSVEKYLNDTCPTDPL